MISLVESLITPVHFLLLAISPLVLLSLCIQQPVGVIHKRNLDIFSPVFLVGGALFLGTTLRTFFLVFDDPEPEKIQRLMGNHLPEEILLPGLIAINLGLAAWTLGYLLVRHSKAPDQRRLLAISTSHYFLAMSLSLLIGVTLVALYLRHVDFFDDISNLGFSAKRFVEIEGIASTAGHLRIGGDLLSGLAIIQACYFYVIDRRKRQACLLVFIILLAVITPVIASVRGELVYLAFSIIIIRHYGYKKIPVSTIVLVLLLSFLLLGFMETIRQRTNTVDEEVSFTPGQVIDTVIYTPHFIGIGKTSSVIAKVPEQVDYLYGKSYAMTLIAPIPRVLWKDKPIVRVGKFVGKKIYERQNKSGVPPGLIGEAFLNYGWPGVIVIAFIFGGISKLAYVALIVKRQPGDVLRLGLYSIIAITIIDILVTDFTGNVMRMTRYVVPFLLFMWLVGRHQLTGNNDAPSHSRAS